MYKNMNLNQLRIFYSAARLLNFTKAAEEMHLTQPGISKHMQELEEYYGTRLFDRLGRKIVLTQAGEALLEATSSIFNTLESVKSRIDKINSRLSGKLTIGAERTIATYLLPDKLVQFRQQYPFIEIRVETGFSLQIIEKVLDNTLELALVGQHSTDPRLSIKTFVIGELILIVSPQHPWAKRKTPAFLHELTSQTMLLGDRGASTSRLVEDLMAQKGIKLDNIIEMGTTEGVKRAVADNLGVSLLSSHVLDHDLKTREIIAVPIIGGAPRRELYLIHHKDRCLSLAAKAFEELLMAD